MNLLHETVSHKRFGRGVVSAFDGHVVTVSFDTAGERAFSYPTAFASFLTAENPAVQGEAEAALREKKSESASVLAYYFNCEGTGAYVMSGDNYPRRIPRDNDNERLRVFRTGGLRGLVAAGMINDGISRELRRLWKEDRDADPGREEEWLRVYQRAGRRALTGYLGTPEETDFDEVSGILAAFHQGNEKIPLKRMGREPDELWYDTEDFSKVRVLILEWTHGNSDCLEGVDIPVLLNSTPAETLEHRKARNRDGKTDSAFTTMVLEIEQRKLEAQAHKAGIILSKQGELLSYREYRRLMAEE